jgi:hypothetical protein
VRLINGYSPIRGAGVGRDFAFYTHGEIDPGMAEYLLGWEGGPTGWLANLGVDGILVAHESALVPKPAKEWQLVHEDSDGSVYHRTGQPLPRLRAIILPNEKSAGATIRLREDSREQVIADVEVGAGNLTATIIFARPFFDGYRAALDGKNIAVESYRGWAPLIRLPAGAHGRLTMTYRPWWLLAGGAIAECSLLFCLGAIVFAQYTSRR